MNETVSRENLIDKSDEMLNDNILDPSDRALSLVEKNFLLHAERGDCSTVVKWVLVYFN